MKAWAGEEKVAQKEGNGKIVCWPVVPTFQSRQWNAASEVEIAGENYGLDLYTRVCRPKPESFA